MFPSIIRKCIHEKFIKDSRAISYYITTPIFYANSSPHIGHVHTLLIADALNVYQRLKLGTDNTIFSSGTDEHGIKIQTAAEAAKIDHLKFCDENSKKFSDIFGMFNTTLTDFIRTTDDRHKRAVEVVWTQLLARGFIYKSTYDGWYSSSEESFVPESQLIATEIDGKTILTDQNGNTVTRSSEENYMFKLTSFKEKILDWLIKEPIHPVKFNDIAISMVQSSDIDDISVSRPVQRLRWGVPVPGDSDQTIYVWLDALTNYLTLVGFPCTQDKLKRWPIDCQVIGKDILKFHAIYWPAFLCALSLPLPKKIICHSHWLMNSRKMSKSVGNVVDPQKDSAILGTEGLRYYLLRAGTTHSDTDYVFSSIVQRVNAELADTYGNLVSRSTAETINPTQVIPVNITYRASPEIKELQARLSELGASCAAHYEVADFYKGVDEIMSILRRNNAIYQHAKPWKLVKDPSSESQEEHKNILAITFETLRICSILLQPIVPKLSNSVLDRLNVQDRLWADAKSSLVQGDLVEGQRKVNQNTEKVIFRRLHLKS